MVDSVTLRRLAALKLPAAAFQEVLSILADMQAADEARREEQRNRKRKSRDGHVTVTGQGEGQGRDEACDISLPPASPVPPSSSPPHPPSNNPLTPSEPPSLCSLRSHALAPAAEFSEPGSRAPAAPRRLPAKKGSRLPAEWSPSAAESAFALDLLGSSWSGEAAKFRDYWHARAGPNAVKIDWSATWRNWCRKAAENPRQLNGNASKPSVSDVLARLCDETGSDSDGLLSEIGRE